MNANQEDGCLVIVLVFVIELEKRRVLKPDDGRDRFLLA
jgi:hypothetical protein